MRKRNNKSILIKTPELDRKQFPEPIHAKTLPATQILGGEDLKMPLANFADTDTVQNVSLRKEVRGVEVSADKQHLLLNSKAVIAHASDQVSRFLSVDRNRFSGQSRSRL